jgi:hypothetical protein
MSETDAAGAAGFTYEDVVRTFDIVRQLWPRIEKAARAEMRLAVSLDRPGLAAT